MKLIGKPYISIRAIYTMAMLNNQRVSQLNWFISATFRWFMVYIYICVCRYIVLVKSSYTNITRGIINPCESLEFFQEILGDFHGGQCGSALAEGLSPQCPGATLSPAGATGATQAAPRHRGGGIQQKKTGCWMDFTWKSTGFW